MQTMYNHDVNILTFVSFVSFEARSGMKKYLPVVADDKTERQQKDMQHSCLMKMWVLCCSKLSCIRYTVKIVEHDFIFYILYFIFS